MAELRNTFSWSFSQAKDFASCRRRFFLQRYGSWGGWEEMAPRHVKAAYRLKQMKNGYALSGMAVDLAVKEAVCRLRSGSPWTLEDSKARAGEFLRKAWVQHKEGFWRSNPKRFTCIQELYYEDFKPEDLGARTAWADAIKQRVNACLENFHEKILPWLDSYVQEGELMPNANDAQSFIESFTLGGLLVYAVPDFVGLHGEEVLIIDWKTGHQKQFYAHQLETYGLWAQVKHKIPVDRIRLNLVYLPDGQKIEVPYGPDIAQSTFKWIRDSVEEMRDMLRDRDVEKNEPLPMQEFEMTARPEICAFCNFAELCGRRFARKCLSSLPSETNDGEQEK